MWVDETGLIISSVAHQAFASRSASTMYWLRADHQIRIISADASISMSFVRGSGSGIGLGDLINHNLR